LETILVSMTDQSLLWALPGLVVTATFRAVPVIFR
jgi:hypothetical protein